MGCENIFGKLRGAKISGQKVRGMKKRLRGAKIFWKNLRGAKISEEKIRGARISTEKINGVKFFAIFQERLRPGIRTFINYRALEKSSKHCITMLLFE